MANSTHFKSVYDLLIFLFEIHGIVDLSQNTIQPESSQKMKKQKKTQHRSHEQTKPQYKPCHNILTLSKRLTAILLVVIMLIGTLPLQSLASELESWRTRSEFAMLDPAILDELIAIDGLILPPWDELEPQSERRMMYYSNFSYCCPTASLTQRA